MMEWTALSRFNMYIALSRSWGQDQWDTINNVQNIYMWDFVTNRGGPPIRYKTFVKYNINLCILFSILLHVIPSEKCIK
jgi:hypothetical protein